MKIKIVLLNFHWPSPSRYERRKMNIQQAFLSLKENANAIVRLNQIDVTISSQRSMAINKRVITVLNEKDFPP
jgi:hypothetical protein